MKLELRTPLCKPLDLHTLSKQNKLKHLTTQKILGTHNNIERASINFNDSLAERQFNKQLEQEQQIDFHTWLPFASKKLNISSDPKDYILVPTIIMPSDLSNANGVGFPLKQLIGWQPEYGCQAYKTAKGKPTFKEHRNDDIWQSKGVIIDSFLRPMLGYKGNFWKLIFLLAFDRSKDNQLCHDILTKKVNCYSMGATVSGYTCSICGKPIGYCTHIGKNTAVNFKDVGGKLAFKQVIDPIFFETSSVKVPAFKTALSDVLIEV